MGFDVLVVIIAIVCAVALLYLRAFLALIFPVLNVRRLPDNASPPAATADLYEKATAELAVLGFSPPQWVVIAPEKETPGMFAMIAAVFCHVKKNTLALVMPPLHLAAPNTPVASFVTLLTDGRKLTSVVRSIASEAFADEKHPAQTIGGDTLAEQWALHRRWLKRFKEPAAPGFGALETLDEHLPLLRFDPQALMTAGKAWRDAQGFIRPTLALALRFLRLHWTRPRPKADKKSEKTNVPLARQAMFAMFNEHWQQRPLPVRWQWLLLGVSSVWFAVLGAVFWEPMLTLVILGVIVLHEGGHYLAMRAFGYRHVQMLALPLFGGVTLGIEQKPSATRRAWMAMMGPLPGIVLGWALLSLIVANGVSAEASPPAIFWAAIALLVINYLNLLPAPPLDGAHIVQAMLPPRWFTARTAFIVVACLACAALAAYAGVYLLTLLPLWQLLWVPSLLASDRAVRLLASDTAFAAASPAQQQRRALEALQQCAGETANITQRLQQMKTVVGALAQTDMNGKQRAALAVVYLGLLCLPLLFLGPLMIKTMAGIEAVPASPQHREQAQRDAQIQAQRKIAEAKSLPQLLADLSGNTPLPPPADEAVIIAAGLRLGQPLPPELRALYRTADGVPGLHLVPLDNVAWAAGHPDWQTLTANTTTLRIIDETVEGFNLPPAAPGWLYLGSQGDKSGDAPFSSQVFLYRPPKANDHAQTLRWLICEQEYCSGYPTIRFWLENTWALQQWWRQYAAQRKQIQQRVFPTLGGLSVPQLLEQLPPPMPLPETAKVTDEGWLWKLSRKPSNAKPQSSTTPSLSLPEPATPEAVAAAQTRLGLTFPGDYLALLSQHDGYPPLRLLPVAQVRRLSETGYLADGELQTPRPFHSFAFPPSSLEGTAMETVPGQRTWRGDELQSCAVIGGLVLPPVVSDRQENSTPAETIPWLLWCPGPAFEQARIVSLQETLWAPDFTTYLRYSVTRAIAERELAAGSEAQ